jgi:hypothetical protein
MVHERLRGDIRTCVMDNPCIICNHGRLWDNYADAPDVLLDSSCKIADIINGTRTGIPILNQTGSAAIQDAISRVALDFVPGLSSQLHTVDTRIVTYNSERGIMREAFMPRDPCLQWMMSAVSWCAFRGCWTLAKQLMQAGACVHIGVYRRVYGSQPREARTVLTHILESGTFSHTPLTQDAAWVQEFLIEKLCVHALPKRLTPSTGDNYPFASLAVDKWLRWTGTPAKRTWTLQCLSCKL